MDNKINSGSQVEFSSWGCWWYWHKPTISSSRLPTRWVHWPEDEERQTPSWWFHCAWIKSLQKSYILESRKLHFFVCWAHLILFQLLANKRVLIAIYYFFCMWNRVSICKQDFPQTLHLPASPPLKYFDNRCVPPHWDPILLFQLFLPLIS
jgi:hypothetical protein